MVSKKTKSLAEKKMTSLGGGKKKGGKIPVVAIAVAAVLVVVVAAVLTLSSGETKKDEESRGSDGEIALSYLVDVAGESSLVSLADLDAAADSGAPEEYLAENSEIILDEDTIEVYVQSYMSAVESTAAAQEVSTLQLIQDWGYENVAAYQEVLEEMVEEFVCQRLAVYTVAVQEGITITEADYSSMLEAYAAEYGYTDIGMFEDECYPQSIANEMLFDTTVRHISETYGTGVLTGVGEDTGDAGEAEDPTAEPREVEETEESEESEENENLEETRETEEAAEETGETVESED